MDGKYIFSIILHNGTQTKHFYGMKHGRHFSVEMILIRLDGYTYFRFQVGRSTHAHTKKRLLFDQETWPDSAELE